MGLRSHLATFLCAGVLVTPSCTSVESVSELPAVAPRPDPRVKLRRLELALSYPLEHPNFCVAKELLGWLYEHGYREEVEELASRGARLALPGLLPRGVVLMVVYDHEPAGAGPSLMVLAGASPEASPVLVVIPAGTVAEAVVEADDSLFPLHPQWKPSQSGVVWGSGPRMITTELTVLRTGWYSCPVPVRSAPGQEGRPRKGQCYRLTRARAPEPLPSVAD